MELRDPAHLANDLLQARDAKPGRGRAVFLIGAGCSVTAGIPAAAGVAQHAAVQLARTYSNGQFKLDGDLRDQEKLKEAGEAAFSKLVELGKIDQVAFSDEAGIAWGRLYLYFSMITLRHRTASEN